MSPFQTFAYSFRNSFLKPKYYKDVLKAPFSFSFKYFLFLFFLIGLITAATISIVLASKVQPYIQQAQTEVLKVYPQNLTLTITNGQVFTNVEEPYFVPIKNEWLPKEVRDNIAFPPVSNLLVIDTKAEPQDIKKYQTLSLLTKDAFVYMQDRNEIRMQSLQDVKSFTLNQEIANAALKQVVPYFKWIIPIIIVLIVIFLPAGLITTKFFYLLVVSLLTLILAKLYKLKFGYGKTLQINMHAITLPLIIGVVFQVLGVQPQIPFFQTIILLIFNLIIFTSIKEK